ncbi:MAG: SDR family NAD(P)-dependent oxidoreductase, partial [Bacteroidota bacterium]
MKIDLTNRHAFVCGSTQGIGWGIAKRLAESGAKITLASRNEAKLAQLKSELPAGPHEYMVLDQSKVHDIEEAADRLKNLTVDILINNPGGPDPGLVHAEPWSKFEQALTQQLRCAHLL